MGAGRSRTGGAGVSADATRNVLLAAISAVIHLDGCHDPRCEQPACWIGCLPDDERAIVQSVLNELGVR